MNSYFQTSRWLRSIMIMNISNENHYSCEGNSEFAQYLALIFFYSERNIEWIMIDCGRGERAGLEICLLG